MQKATFVVMLVASIAIGSVLYLLDAQTQASSRESDTQPQSEPISFFTRTGSPYEQHVQEAMDASPSLKAFAKKVAKLEEQVNAETRTVNLYKAHLDGYFNASLAEAQLVSDTALRQILVMELHEKREAVHQRLVEKEAVTAQMTSKLKRVQDLLRSMQIMSSLQKLNRWERDHSPEMQGAVQAIQELDSLIGEKTAPVRVVQ